MRGVPPSLKFSPALVEYIGARCFEVLFVCLQFCHLHFCTEKKDNHAYVTVSYEFFLNSLSVCIYQYVFYVIFPSDYRKKF